MKALLALALASSATLLAQAPQPSPAVQPAGSQSLLLVVNQGDGNVSLIDPRTQEQIVKIPENVPSNVGHEIAVSADARYAYVPLYGDSGVGRPGTDGRLMLVIDIGRRAFVNRVDFGHGVRPHCVVRNPQDGLLYVTTELDKTVTLVDPKTLKVVGSIPTGEEQSHMLALSHDGRRGYTANVGPGTVSVLDLKKRTLITTIPIAKNTQRISISPDDSMVFTADQTTPRLAVIDTATNKVRQWITLPSRAYGTASTPDGRFLLVTLPDTGELAVVSLQTLKLVRTVKVGPRSQEVVLSADGKTAWVSSYTGDEVVAVDVPTWTAHAPVKTGREADGMAWVAANR